MREKEARLAIRVEYVGIIAIICLFAGVLIGGSIKIYHNPSMLEQINRETDYDTLVGIGNDAYDHGSTAIAITAYEKALSFRADDPDLLTDLGTMYLKNNEAERAIKVFRKAAGIAPKHAQSRYNLGVALNTIGDKEGARKAFEDVIHIAPNTETARNAKKEITDLGK